MSDLQNLRVLVTGAGQGLGRGIVDALYAHGARVVATDLPDHPGPERPGSDHATTSIGSDLETDDAAAHVVAGAVETLGGIDALVSCHAFMEMGTVLEQDPSTWWRHIRVNLRSNLLLTQALLPHMTAQGHGRIVFIGSEAGSVGMKYASGYSASKAGLATFTKTIARELGPLGIVSNLIAPSYADTPQLHVDAEFDGVTVADTIAAASERIPIGRVAQPSDVARTVVHLLGPYGGSVLGQILNTNGGSFRGRV